VKVAFKLQGLINFKELSIWLSMKTIKLMNIYKELLKFLKRMG